MVREVATTFDAALQFVGGIEAFSDAELSKLIGRAPWATTAEKLGVDPMQSVSFTAQEAGITAILVTHDQNEAFAMADDIGVMREGRIVDSGSPKALIAKYGRTTLEDVFLDVARKGALTEATP